MTKDSKIIVFALIVLLFGVFVFYYLKSPPPTAEELKEAKLKEISQSLTVQEQTPQFKAKLSEMSKSLK